jgi:hypothetical protein
MIARAVLICLLSAQFPQQEDILRLARIKQAIKRHLDAMPNYTCLETIERSEQLPGAAKPSLIDVLRLEVAYVGGKELFAWPGSTRFEDNELRGLVTTGAFSTGGFVLHARAVFLGDGTTFRFGGAEELDGVAAWRYDYVTPELRSGYQIRNPRRGVGAIVGYTGSIWARQDNLELLRMSIDAEDIPAHIEIREAHDRLDYQLMPIGQRQALLPRSHEIRIHDVSGRVATNRTRLTRCREYAGESTLKFDEEEVAALTKQPPRLLELAPYTEISLALSQEITHEDAAVGDAIEATLAQDIRVGKTVLARKGAVAKGRILRLSRAETTHITYNVTFEFTMLEGEDFAAPLKLRYLRSEPDVSTPPELKSPRRGAFSFDLPNTDPNGFLVFARRLRLPRGFVTVWETQK